MKKTRIFAVIVSLLILLAFSGCDAILEAFYPEFTAGGKDGGDNGISIWVDIELPADGLPEDADPKIAAILLNTDFDFFDEMYVFPEWNWDDGTATWILSASIDFYGVASDEEYQILVWLEINDDYEPNWGEEPQAFAEWVLWDDAAKEDIKMGPFFPFPNEENLNWLNGYAFIPFGSGQAFDPVFKLKGEFTIEKDSPTVEVYTVEPRDGNRVIAEIEANIYSASWAWVAGYSDWDVHTYSTTFSFDYNSIAELGPAALPVGDYWLDVWVLYEDGHEFIRAWPLRVLDEAGLVPYDLNVYLEDLDGWPYELATDQNYTVRATIYSPNAFGDLVAGATQTLDVFYSSGALNLPVEANQFTILKSMTYNPSMYNSANGVDWIEVAVDMSGAAGVIDGADLVLFWPIGLSVADGTAARYDMYAGAWDLVPLPPPLP
jgi:hypothetical protein